MAVTAAELLDPVGRIHPDFFPAESSADLTARVDGWIDQAEADPRIAALTEPDAAVTAYVYHRALAAVCDRLNVHAARLDFADAGGRTMLKEQLAYFAGERDQFADQLLAIIAAADADADAPLTGAPLPSSYVALQFTF